MSLLTPAERTEKLSRIALWVGLGLLVIAPFVGLYPIFMMKALCYAIFACAFNLLLGYTGLLSFGHAAYLGLAAYSTGWLVRSAGWSPELGVLAGTLLAALCGLAIGLIAIRRQGIYFAMVTLAMAQMVYFVFLQAPFTGGEDGLQGVPRGKLFGLLPLDNDTTLYFVVLAVFVAVFLFIIRIVHSPYGQVLKAIRENEPRAVSLGYDVDRYKLLAFVLSTGIAGLAGSLKTMVLGFVSLTDAHWSLSGEVVLMTLLGGMGTFEIVSRNPRLFAAAFPVCGGADTASASKLKKVNWWIFHGAKDDVVLPQYSERIVTALKKINARVIKPYIL